jgi:hypothetical protein
MNKKKTEDFSERRGYIRKPLEVEVNFSKKYTVKMENISESGVSLITDEGLTTGNILKLNFTLPKGDEVNVFGEVVWSKKLDDNIFANGLEFWQIDEHNLEKIKKYIRS